MNLLNNRAFNMLVYIAEIIGVIAIFIMMLLTTADVIGRYVFNMPVQGTHELTAILMGIFGFFCLGYTQLRKRHVAITFIVDKLQINNRAVIDIIGHLFGLIMMGVIAWQLVVQAETIRLAAGRTPVLAIPTYPFLWLAAFGCVILALVLINDLSRSLSSLGKADRKQWIILSSCIVLMCAVMAVALYGNQLPFQFSPTTVGLIIIIILFILLFSGMPIAFAMGIVGLVGAVYLVGGKAGIALMGIIPYSETASYTLGVVAMFILMGMVCYYSGMSEDLYETAHKWFARLSGGLAMASAAACAGFAAVSGSSMATAATMGTVALPQMRKYKYSDELSTGVICAAGTMGILIPPSIILVIYGIITEQSIAELFMAGIIPGILEAVFYIITIFLLCRINPLMGPRGPRTSIKEKVSSLGQTWPIIVLFCLVIGGIYAGVFTPNEAGAVGAFGAFLFAFIRRRLNWSKIRAAMEETGLIACMTTFIIVGAMMVNYTLSISTLPFMLAEWVSQMAVSHYVIVALIVLVYFVLGCFMNSMAMILLTIPIFYPIVLSLGLSPIWFGILAVRVVEMAQITPPYGINLFIIKGIVSDVSMGTIYKGVVPFIIADILHIALLIAWPGMATWLPSLMKGI